MLNHCKLKVYSGFFFFVTFCFRCFLLIFDYIFVPHLYRHLNGDKLALMYTYGTLMENMGDEKNK